MVSKVDLDGTGVEGWFLCCIKFETAHRQAASEFVCVTEEINTFAKEILDWDSTASL